PAAGETACAGGATGLPDAAARAEAAGNAQADAPPLPGAAAHPDAAGDPEADGDGATAGGGVGRSSGTVQMSNVPPAHLVTCQSPRPCAARTPFTSSDVTLGFAKWIDQRVPPV